MRVVITKVSDESGSISFISNEVHVVNKISSELENLIWIGDAKLFRSVYCHKETYPPVDDLPK